MRELKEQRKEAKRLIKMPPGKFNAVDLSTRPHPDWMTRAFTNNRYCVMIMDNCPTTKGNCIRAMIQRHDDIPIPNHWAELQKIKNELFGHEATGIEYYPRHSELVNFHNIYWMFIFPDDILPKILNNEY